MHLCRVAEYRGAPRVQLGVHGHARRQLGREQVKHLAYYPLDVDRHTCADRSGNGGKDIDQLCRCRDAAASELPPGEFDDQWNVENFAVQKYAVFRFAVIAQPLAVIATENDERLIVEAARFQFGEEAADDGVGGRDLAIVWIAVLRFERLDRLVGRVRLEEVKKEKEWTGLHTIDPAESHARCFVAAPLNRPESRRLPYLHRVPCR